MVDAFDADVLIFAASRQHPDGAVIRAVLQVGDRDDRIGSVLLLPELLSKPRREHDDRQLGRLAAVLGLLDLRPVDTWTAEVAVELAAKYRLRAADSVHLATAVVAGADRFITNNVKDFRADRIGELDVVHPADLRG
jgi:predicted nucleic acid-binding protein